MMNDDFVQRIVDDLRAFSGDLTDDVAAAARERPRPRGPGGRMQALITAAEALLVLAPTLLDEAADLGRSNAWTETESVRPVRARLSRRPRDWQMCDGRLLPRRWVGIDPARGLPTAPLRWLLHLADTLAGLLRDARRRHETRMSQAARARSAELSHFVADEVRALRARGRQLEDLELRLGAFRSTVLQAASERIAPSERLPQPYPHGDAWRSLRRRAPAMLDPRRALASWGDWFASGVDPADLAFLYQRWCGLKVVELLRRAGFEAAGDVAGCLLYGGKLAFVRAGVRLDLWVEIQLVRGRRHESGFTCVEKSAASPDYLFVTDGPHGRSAFVLDATLANEDDVFEQKSKYLETIASWDAPLIGGVPTAPETGSPVLAWAAAPSRAPHARHVRRDGRGGVVPMHPVEWNERPLAAFLDYLVRHAEAWRAAPRPIAAASS